MKDTFKFVAGVVLGAALMASVQITTKDAEAGFHSSPGKPYYGGTANIVLQSGNTAVLLINAVKSGDTYTVQIGSKTPVIDYQVPPGKTWPGIFIMSGDEI